jgi:hypothetical protein
MIYIKTNTIKLTKEDIETAELLGKEPKGGTPTTMYLNISNKDLVEHIDENGQVDKNKTAVLNTEGRLIAIIPKSPLELIRQIKGQVVAQDDNYIDYDIRLN